MNKRVYLGLSILELSKILMYEFWYDNVKPQYDEKAKLCYVDTDNFIVYIKTDDIYKDIAEDAETRFDTSNYELDRPLPKGQNKKVIGLMKDELSGKINQSIIYLFSKEKTIIDKYNEIKLNKTNETLRNNLAYYLL